jgi:concanavalin A-like lectin/glucanase superfamily protein
MSTMDDLTERELEGWLQDSARPMPQYVLESSLETVARTPQVSPNGPFGIPWLNRRLLAVGAVAAVLLVAISLGPTVLDRLGRLERAGGVGAPTCAPPPSGLTGWWPGDGSVDDIIGDLDAELVGGTTFAPGLVGEAFRLDGDGDFIDVADDPALDVGRRDFSVSLWVWFDTTDGEQVLVEKWVQSFDQPAVGWTLTKLDTNVLGFFAEDGLGDGNGATSSPLELPIETWLHIAARRVGGTVDLFMNGERIATASRPGGILDLDSAASLKLGHRGGPRDTPGSQDEAGHFLAGSLDEVQYAVGRGVTDGEVEAIYRAGVAGSCKS